MSEVVPGYEVKTRCENCGTEARVAIPKGTSVNNYPCRTCGVAALRLDQRWGREEVRVVTINKEDE